MFDHVVQWLRGGKGSKDVGKSRLKLILAWDRTEISPEILDALKEDIFNTISKYFKIKEDDVQMKITRNEETLALMANIAILSVKRQGINLSIGNE